jgi:hypothetical protein
MFKNCRSCISVRRTYFILDLQSCGMPLTYGIAKTQATKLFASKYQLSLSILIRQAHVPKLAGTIAARVTTT